VDRIERGVAAPAPSPGESYESFQQTHFRSTPFNFGETESCPTFAAIRRKEMNDRMLALSRRAFKGYGMRRTSTFNRYHIVVAVLWMFTGNIAWGDIHLPTLLSSGMVLQRDSRVALWGWADPGEKIRIKFHDKLAIVSATRDGRWSTSLGPFAAGGPYKMDIAGKNRIALHDVLIGDLWLASGQSNMEFPLKAVGGEDPTPGVIDAEHEAAGAHFPEIRLFKVRRQFALTPQNDVKADTWTAVTPETVGSFSAVAYLFGRELHQRYHVPIGLIESSWGGTVAEAWVSENGLKNFPEFRDSIESLKHIDEKASAAEYDQYVKQKAAWKGQHATEDRGREDAHYLWAARDFSASAWPTVSEPQTKAAEDLKGFDGVVWFRKEIDLPAERAGKDLTLHLGHAYKSDTTYFNGTLIGETESGDKPTVYRVPGKLVDAGRNVIAVRLTGSNGFVGMYSDEPDKLNVEVGGQLISLAGPWSFQPGPDLTDLPRPSAYSKFYSEPNTSTLLFNGMIAPLVPYTLKGAIWYQGESNAIDNRSLQYRTLFPALIQDWRKQWGYNFPFLFVQLAGWPPDRSEPAESAFAELREAQSMTLTLPATGMASAVDQPDNHPRDKQTVAHRLFLAAAKVVYGENIVDSGPVFKSMQIEGSQIRIKFSSLGSGLRVHDRYGYARGFAVAGADGKFQWAQARQDGDDMVVSSAAIQEPIAVRYDWSNTPDGNVYNGEGLPAISFRTDRKSADFSAKPQ
jgi:sialate O-acetylesterase